MEACANIEEVKAFRGILDAGAKQAGRDPKSVKLVARLNTCIADNGQAARDALRPTVARLLGAARLKFTTAEAQGLTLPAELVQSVAGAAYASGFTPYLPLLRHVTSFTLAGNVQEVTQQVLSLRKAGVDSIMVMPFAAEGTTIEDTIARFGLEVWPAVQAAEGKRA
jgi:5,10-methylenetetrahydromethanopterin reductase